MALSKEEILQAIERRLREAVPVDVPDWGGVVYIRRLPVAELKALGLEDGGRPSTEQTVQLLAACLADERGERLFADGEVSALARADLRVFTGLLAAALRENGLLSAELEEMVAGFAGAQRDAGSSG